MFKFERLCFCTRQDNYEYLFGEKGNPPVLHLYEIIEEDFHHPENETREGPFALRLITDSNSGDFPVVYELQDPCFDKDRPRKKFDWRVLPSGLDRAALNAANSYIHRFYSRNSVPDDTDLPGQMFYYYKKLFAGIDDDLSEEKKEGAIHCGNGGIGHWGINPCHRIRLIQ